MGQAVKMSDWVTTSTGGRGLVQRVAKDGSWADVAWIEDGRRWTKRMKPENLIVQSTIKCFGDWEITDIQRERELKEAK